ncbi:MAG: LysR family transcriptional regulator [Thermoanaerobaculia bacterium]
MELHHARAFLAVAREGSVTRAAAKIFRTQPTVTMAIQSLERQLKTRLFEGAGRGVRLTPAGQRLFETLAPLVEQWDTVPSRLIDAVDGKLRGSVRIGAGEAALLYLLPGPLRFFRQRHPEVEIVIRHQPADGVLAALREGALDLGVRSLPAPPADFEFQHLITSDRVLIGPRGHRALRGPPKLAALAEHSFILPPRGSTTRALLEGAFAEANLPLSIAVEAGGWEIVKRYAAIGLGLAVIPAFCVLPADRVRLASRPAASLFGRDTYGLVTRRGRELEPACKAFIARLRV